MSSFISAAPVASGQVQSLDSLRGHSLPTDAMIVASATQVNPTNQNTGSYIINDQVSGSAPTINGSVPAVTASPFADLYKEGSVFIDGVAADYISTALTGYTMSQGISMEMFVNYQNFTNSTYTIGFMAASAATYNFTLGVNGSAAPIVTWTGGTLVSSVTVSANTWNHLACSWDGTTLRLYVNGALGNSTTSFTPPTLAQNFLVGRANSLTCTAYVTDVRIVTNPAVYVASTLTVPSAPLSLAAAGTTNFMLRAGQNSPTVQNGALTFDRGLKQFAQFGSQTFNIATRGFTAMFRYTWNGTVSSYERIFTFTGTTANTNNALTAARNASAGQLELVYYVGGVATVLAYSGTLNQGTNYVMAFVYNPSVGSGTGQWWVNGSPSGSPITSLSSSVTSDLLTPFTFVGCDHTGAGSFTSMTSNTFAIYNRALSNVEIYNSYLALNTVPATPQQKTLEIGDINGTPALSVAGNGQVSVQSIGLSSNVVPWPPAAMTGYVTSINGKNYVASASSDQYTGSVAYAGWTAFAKGASGALGWVTVSGTYNTSAPYGPTGPTTTVDVNGSSYPGEWLQIQIPSSIVLSNYQINTGGSSTSQRPSKWFLLGSRDGVNWFLIDSQNGVTLVTSTFVTFTVPVGQAFTYFRWVVNQLGGAPFCNGGQIVYYGTADASPTLTIAPATTFNTSVATPSLSGIPGNSLVPQDFSSSGLNIPAYVVSNTATTANTVAFSSFGPFAGEGSLYFPGGKGAYVAFPSGTSPNFSISGSTVATFECWFYPTGAPGATFTIFSHALPYTSGIYDWSLFIETNNKLGWYGSSGVPVMYSTNTTNFNAWNHAAWSFSSGTIYIALNGTVNTGTVGTPPNTSGWPLVIGTSAYSGANISNYWGYLSGVRIVSGQALYTTTFTPPTGPLQPIQGTTQAGLPYGTVLLLRNAPAPGRIQTTRLTGSNSVGVNGAPLTLPFPPAAMTGYSTALNAGYGQGTYVASASNEYSGSGWTVFDKNTANYWQAASTGYNQNIAYTGSVVTTDVNGNSYGGDWVQIILPSSIVLSNYTLTTEGSGNWVRKWFILGSRDATNWNLVDQQNYTGWAAVSSASSTFTVNASQAFNYYRFVENMNGGASSGFAPAIKELVLNGTLEAINITNDGRVGLGVVNPTRALEVAGDVVCGGTLSAGNPLMFRNALYNGDMRINQRGILTNWASPTAIGTSITTYATDRWNPFRNSSQTGSAVAQGTLATTDAPYFQGLQYYLRVGRVSGDTGTQQIVCSYQLETRDSLRFAGQPATVSFWYRTGSGFSGTLQINWFSGTGTDQSWRNGVTGAYTISGQTFSNSNAWQYASVTGFVPLTATQLLFGPQYIPSGTAGGFDYFDVTGVQLEKGSVATPFEVRPYATELALCQRYYFASIPGNPGGTTGGTVGAVASSTASLMTNMRTPVTLRANPSTYVYNNGTANQLRVTVNGSTVNGTSLTSAGAGLNGVAYLGFSGAVFTAGSAYDFDIVLSAEL